jgi:glycosyltransferase involved in cell wall biosynthesis
LPKDVVRKALNLPSIAHIIVFGAIDGSANPIKGYDLLHGALEILERERNLDLVCVVVGGTKREANNLRFTTRYLGHLSDDVSMALLYNAADVVVVPSRVESFGQVAAEAIACGTPVAAFATTGLLDVVEHEVTGYLATAFEVDSLARGILWCLENSGSPHIINTCRKRAEELWSYPKVAKQYMDIYRSAVNGA